MLKLVGVALVVIGCGSKPPPPPAPKPVASPTPVVADKPAPPKPEDKPTEPAKPALEDPPWSTDALEAAKVPKVYVAEHKKAKNKATCPLLVITDFGGEADAKPRAANFAGGWAVAYDTKKQRSAFGVAGAGVEKGGGPSWPNNIKWSDGSAVGYGPEGGTGPKSLAYLEVSDAGCLYNVWSTLGEPHLVQVIKSLRHVK
jgi:hypothetical protein